MTGSETYAPRFQPPTYTAATVLTLPQDSIGKQRGDMAVGPRPSRIRSNTGTRRHCWHSERSMSRNGARRHEWSPAVPRWWRVAGIGTRGAAKAHAEVAVRVSRGMLRLPPHQRMRDQSTCVTVSARGARTGVRGAATG
jgi:hypothetical protein